MENIIWFALVLFAIYKIYSMYKESKENTNNTQRTKISYTHPSESTSFKPLYLAAHYSIISGLNVDQVQDKEINNASEKEGWKESWNVYNHDTAIESLEWLQKEGHRRSIKKYVNLFNGSNWVNVTKKTKALLPQLKDAKEKLGITGPLPNIGAWDYARIANNARIFHSFGYISAAEANTYLQAAVNLAKSDYPDWKSYSEGFIIGRHIWAEEFSDQFFEIHQLLLSENESPFIKSPFG